MQNNALNELEQMLWGDIIHGSSFPELRPLLAHYTSIATFEKILVNDEFWLASPLYMNDIEELRFGMIEGEAEFRRSKEIRSACGGDDIYSRLMKQFDDVLNDFYVNHVLDTYVMCFSEHDREDNDGRLSMWRAYGGGGNGVAIVIDTEQINSLPESPLLIAKVKYASQADRLEWIRQKTSMVADTLKKYPKTDDDLRNIAEIWINRLKMFSLSTKHSGFCEEKEWRVVYRSERDPERKFKDMFRYLVSPNGFEPKLKLKIAPLPGIMADDMSMEKIIERIILGPSISNKLAENCIKKMLFLIGKEKLCDKVVASTIPYRP